MDNLTAHRMQRIDNHLLLRQRHEVVRIEPWGPDCVRVRASQHGIPTGMIGALEDHPTPTDAVFDVADDGATIVNGTLTVEVRWHRTGPLLRFLQTDTGEELLAETPEHFMWPGARVYSGNRAGKYAVEQHFRSYPGERLYGLGQRTHGRLDHKGLSLDLRQRNAEVSVPFVLSSRGYGLLWNNPALGRVDFSDNLTRWSADQTSGIDYFITVGPEPARILQRYADATGHAPKLPSWASGFWQSKLRYHTQEELMQVAREHRRRGLPLAVIVADFFHWTNMGDFAFDETEWPDPAGMVAELEAMGTKLMVSIWPTVSPSSRNYRQMEIEGQLVDVDQSLSFPITLSDKATPGAPLPLAFYDATNPRTREFVWARVKENYFDLGIRAWWLDACEPDVKPGSEWSLSYDAGPGPEVSAIYPRENARLFAEGMAATDDPETVLLCRSAWAGQQKYPAALWSGDIPATWDSLRQQVAAGLNVGIAGIPWWTTDIGGFHGGDPRSPAYRELMIRWFQYGVFCPLFRLHGHREPRASAQAGVGEAGGPNEVWSFGDEAYEHITACLRQRERLRPYVHQELDRTSQTGVPTMRPLFVDYSHDRRAWEVEDQFMFGADILVAPVLAAQVRQREVYLPEGARWTDPSTGETFDGGQVIQRDAPLSRIPVLLREGARDLAV